MPDSCRTLTGRGGVVQSEQRVVVLWRAGSEPRVGIEQAAPIFGSSGRASVQRLAVAGEEAGATGDGDGRATIHEAQEHALRAG